jgi:hypothetical protein
MTSRRIWAGRILTGLVTAFLLIDGGFKVFFPGPAVAATAQLGYPEHLILPIGIIELACLAVYLIPQTSALGAVLLTGFLGGAVSTHFRVGDPLLGFTLFPLYVGAFVWAGLFLRDNRLRALVPFGAARRSLA